jgi:ubiquinone biosynthesis protein UbiJ
MLTRIEDPLWQQITHVLNRLLRNEGRSDIARLWLVGQVLQPLTAEQGSEQARVING